MKLLLLSDIHSDFHILENLSQELKTADIVIIAGDMTNFGGKNQAAQIIESIKKFNCEIFAVPGNCDPKQVGDYLKSEDISLDCKLKNRHGINFVGIGGVLPERYFSSQAISNFTDLIESASKKSEPIIIVSHQPAQGVSVALRGYGEDGGSSCLRGLIDAAEPVLAISGHIHEAFGYEKIGKTTFINPGAACSGSYAVLEINDSEIEDIKFKTV